MSAYLGIRSPPPRPLRLRGEASHPSPFLRFVRFPASAPNLDAAAASAASISRPPIPKLWCHAGRSDRLLEAADEGEGFAREKIVRTLLIDNYDSYTYNIYQELSVVNGVPPVVIRNDEWTMEHVRRLLYEEKGFDNIVISPGPGSPACSRDIGICLDILLECEDVPILGVCLGHQALGFVHGAEIVHAPEPVHGLLSEIEHNGCGIYCGIPSGINSGFEVVRYHSLVIDADTLPKELVPVAWTTSTGAGLSTLNIVNDLEGKRVLMGVMHCDRPHYGVQFHPESIATRYGRKIFENFKKMTVGYGLRSSLFKERKVSYACQSSIGPAKGELLHNEATLQRHLHICNNPPIILKSSSVKHLRLEWRKIDSVVSQIGGSKNIFCDLFGDESAENTFWLDSSSTDQGRARFSFMGGKGGSLWKQLTFRLADRQSKQTPKAGGYLSIQDGNGHTKTKFLVDGLFDFLNKALLSSYYVCVGQMDRVRHMCFLDIPQARELRSFHYDKEDYEGLPFDFCGGFIGYIGYNLKIECGASSNRYMSTTPDACFFFADNLVVIDHSNGDVYILSIDDIHHPDTTKGSREITRKHLWLIETEKRLLKLKDAASQNLNMKSLETGSRNSFKESFVVEKSRQQYIKDVEKCLKLIRDGESYELCLTTQMKRRIKGTDYLQLYLNLREQNPAPYAAWLNFAGENLCICCSSPERFLRLDGSGKLEAKPIKGTIARGRTIEEDEHLRLQLKFSKKDRAENLMIVDLLRNDLGRVCEPGTVCVPSLMEVESYATVHTMVSTIQGKKSPNMSPIDCIRAAFPGGSMTGAPKLRSMELLDSLENSSRGIYSGCIGFLSYNQTFDLNIVIRTIIIHEGEAAVGAGGAIVALSNPEEEYEEMMLKAKAPKRVVDEHATIADSSDIGFKMAI